jgi:lysozyme family protein
MADVKLLAPKIAKLEGGYSNDPIDKGNYDASGNLIGSNLGVTPAAFKQAFGHSPTVEEMKNLTIDQFTIVLKTLYWDKWLADQITNQSVANILVDWVYNSGSIGITKPQILLGVTPDGIVGNETITALNKMDQQNLFTQVFNLRVKFYNDLVTRIPVNAKYLRGWMSRLNSYTFSK